MTTTAPAPLEAAPERPSIPSRLPHVPALDGLRGLAVIAVLLGHSGFVWARGGFLGVTSFFVLSGFLITGLLLAEFDRHGRIDLKHFWSRRARRLAPAIPVLFALVIGYLALAPHRAAPGLLGDAVASLTWVANWRFVFAHRSYAALFADPSPFQHMWSLAVEEQFYLALPLLAVALLRWRRGAGRWWLAGVGVVGIAASTWAAAALHPMGAAPGRAYFGTDARVAEPLVGVVLAVLLVAPTGRRVLARGWRVALDVFALGGAAGLGLLMYRLTDHSDSLYRGGFLAAALCTAAILASATQPGTVISRALAVEPLVSVGRVSYGIYLFHWPIFLALTARSTGLSPVPLLGLRATLTMGVAFVSYAFIERPVRWGQVAGRLAAIGWVDASVGLLAALVLITMPPVVSHPKATTVATRASGARSPAGAASRAGASPTTQRPAAPVTAKPVLSSATKPQPHAAPGAGAAAAMGQGNHEPSPPPPTPLGPNGKPPLKVVVVGDSMGDNLANGLISWSKAQGDVVTYNLTIPGCPLSVGGGTRKLANGDDFSIGSYCDWWTDSTSQRSTYFRQFAPDVVVVEDGLNEVPDRITRDWSTYRHPGQANYDNWLMQQYSNAAATFTSKGARLLFLNTGCADWGLMGGGFVEYQYNSDGDSRVTAVNRTTTAAAANGAQVADLHGHLCPNGQFTQTVDGVSNARPDGYHLIPAAQDAVAQRWLGPLVRQISQRSVIGP